MSGVRIAHARIIDMPTIHHMQPTHVPRPDYAVIQHLFQTPLLLSVHLTVKKQNVIQIYNIRLRLKCAFRNFHESHYLKISNFSTFDQTVESESADHD